VPAEGRVAPARVGAPLWVAVGVNNDVAGAVGLFEDWFQAFGLGPGDWGVGGDLLGLVLLVTTHGFIVDRYRGWRG
jgi:hypothetical protein